MGFDVREAWKVAWMEKGAESILFDFDIHSSTSKDFQLPRKIWCNLNRLRTGHGRCNDMMYKWRIIDDPSCPCGALNQTTNHMLLDCPIWSYNGNVAEIKHLVTYALEWLSRLQL